MQLPQHVKQTISDLEQMAHDSEGLAVSYRLMANSIRTVFENQKEKSPQTPKEKNKQQTLNSETAAQQANSCATVARRSNKDGEGQNTNRTCC